MLYEVITKAGEIVLSQWMGLPKHYPFVRLDVVAVMPGHVHGLLWMESPDGHRITSYNVCYTKLLRFCNYRLGFRWCNQARN